ncbi:MAG: manganese efflux pump [Ruminococcus sp.]|nr:manganese efflux pump [Ruminococcus sp.]
MGIIELILISIGLSMDAFAVSVCKGLNIRRINYKCIFVIGLFFGGFQALMPLLGWLMGAFCTQYITDFSHWIAMILLTFIGAKMIFESFKHKGEEYSIEKKDTLNYKELFLLAIATSIDALAVGVTFAVLPDTNIFFSISMIGIITLILSCIGVVIGNRFGSKYENKAEFAGGAILIIIGVKILLEGIGII